MNEEELKAFLIDNPGMLDALKDDEAVGTILGKYGDDALKSSRDKVIKSNQNYKTRNNELEEQVTHFTQVESSTTSTPAPKEPVTGDNALLERIAMLEKQNADAVKQQLNATIREQRDAALAGLNFKEGGMAMAQQHIDLASFEVNNDGSIRHKDNAMPVGEFITAEWSKSNEASFFLDTSASGGAGAVGAKRATPLNHSNKSFKESTTQQRTDYFKQNGAESYGSWKIA